MVVATKEEEPQEPEEIAEETEIPEEKHAWVLGLDDYCDASCSAQAFVRVVLPSGDVLDFCGHHFELFKADFTDDHEIIDERDRINIKKGYS